MVDDYCSYREGLFRGREDDEYMCERSSINWQLRCMREKFDCSHSKALLMNFKSILLVLILLSVRH